MKEENTKIVGKSAKAATQSNTSCRCSCGFGSANFLTTRKSKKIGISDAEPKTQQGLSLESNSNKKRNGCVKE